MIEIDGSQGEGGGQILRTSLSLAMCLGKSLHIKNIRQGRPKTGLLRQHLACVNLAATICNAEVEGAHLGSTELFFHPKKVEAGDYDYAVGSAGSTTLIFQTVLPALMQANAPSTLKLIGGTHNSFAPSVTFIEKSFIPLLKQLGVHVESHLIRYGFNGVGGGEWQLKIHPAQDGKALKLIQRKNSALVTAQLIGSQLPERVFEREKRHFLEQTTHVNSDVELLHVEAGGSGNCVSLQINEGTHTSVFESLGAKRVSSERVVNDALARMNAYLKNTAPVEEYLSDQLLLPMLLTLGGEFVVQNPSLHFTTHCQVITLMTGKEITMEELGEGLMKVTVPTLK